MQSFEWAQERVKRSEPEGKWYVTFQGSLLQKEAKKWEIEELLTNFCSLSLEGVPLTVAIQQEKLHGLDTLREFSDGDFSDTSGCDSFTKELIIISSNFIIQK